MKRLLSALGLSLCLAVSVMRVGAQPSGFVYLSGGQFYFGDQQINPYWTTFYPYWDHNGHIYHGSAWHQPDFSQYIDFMIAMAQQANVNTLRATDWLDGSTADWHDPVVWSNMDYFVQATAANNMYAIIDISAYRKWLIANNTWPYDPNLWSDFIQLFGDRYGNTANILYVPIAGEIPYPTSSNPWKATANEYVAFFTQTLAALHAADPNHLHTVGGLSFLNRPEYGIPWQTLFSLPYNDFCDMHEYSDGDLNVTLPMLSDWCGSNGIPLLLEEFGAKQQIGDQARADHFNLVYGRASQYNVVGVGLWNLGPELAPSSYEVNPQTPLAFAAIQNNAPPH